MKILILGASGLIGWNLLHTARSLGHETIGTYRSHSLAGLVPMSLEDESSVAQLIRTFRPEAVFFCSGWSWVDGCESDPARAYRENAQQPAWVAQYAAEIGCHFTYFSTSYVFDGTEGPYAEDAVACPISVYGHSKHEGERAIFRTAAGRTIVARTMGVYGPEPQQKNFVYQVRKSLAEGKPIRVPNDQFGNVTYAPDLARMILDLVRQNRSGIWNLAGPNPFVRRSDFAFHIAQSYGLPIDLIEPVDTPSLRQAAPRPKEGGLYVEKIVQATGTTPKPWVKIP